ncbi:MAG TPA: CPBP family intramembrane glutamic endopeptidase [Longimicrobiales bacterium]|nr:CPBP family intramembrane glutamic endopeptidase [Longimicrobiales bacterium]
MYGARTLPWPAGWPGEALRLVAFGLLFLALAALLSPLWWALPVPRDGIGPYAATAVTAAAALAAGWLLLRVADGRSAGALGTAVSGQAMRQAGVGMGVGLAGLTTAVVGIGAVGSLTYSAAPGTTTGWLTTVALHGGVFTVAALAEEALFRGYPFQVLARWAGPVVATAVTSVLFAAAHGMNPEVGVLALLNIFLAGVLLAVAYLRTLSLWFATAVHMAWNWAMATLFDLPVSGIAAFDTPLYDASVGGPQWWTGGGFGPEGGLVGSLGFGVALLLVLRLRVVAPDTTIVAAGPLVLDRTRGVAQRMRG